MGMFFIHPIFLGCSVICAFAYYRTVKKKFWNYAVSMGGMLIGLSLINPMFNTYGETVLFTYLNGRPYTWEAFRYGLSLAAMFVVVITWFATYNQVMTSDKFLYCFGRVIPSVSIIFTMVLRMVPEFRKKSRQITEARKGIGKSAENSNWYEKVKQGMAILSALTSWALEGSVTIADSMAARGYGCEKRTSYSIYRWEKRDKCLLGVMIVLLIVIAVCAFQGGMKAEYIPVLEIAGIENGWTFTGSICYFLFLSIPTGMNMMEELTWRILKSKI